ncbi:hypothetical protein Scep_019535 [Stephania cephalantha]|uniref:Reverse transcriptase domain-containing protein n=1 Tax=Stephania cephalantha TaxID=152367 RepID=A0AAP0NPX0_9MAGN
MPFGLSNAPSSFQATVNNIFREFLRRYVLMFFDDILIYSESWPAHITHLTVILETLRRHQLFVKLSKCEFGTPSIAYLGHIISDMGVSVDPSKIEVIKAWALPKTVKQLRGFLGLTGYYCRFVSHFATFAGPLTAFQYKDSFVWSRATTDGFQALKTALMDTPILALPNFSDTFTIHIDASAVGIGVVLSQSGHPIAYFSKTLPPRMQLQSAYAREFFAITEVVRKWRQYLFGRHFIIVTDH